MHGPAGTIVRRAMTVSHEETEAVVIVYQTKITDRSTIRTATIGAMVAMIGALAVDPTIGPRTITTIVGETITRKIAGAAVEEEIANPMAPIIGHRKATTMMIGALEVDRTVWKIYLRRQATTTTPDTLVL